VTAPEIETGAGPLLDIRDLSVTYSTGRDKVRAVRDVSLTVEAGQMVGIAGESGSGKTTLALSLLRLLPPSSVVTGDVMFRGENLLTVNWARLRAVRWAEASVVFQGAMSALNPVRTVGEQICEPIQLHSDAGNRQARARTAALLDSVGVPASRAASYPHELSGGQRQRVMIAMALACDPDLIIADEPTTALDVIVHTRALAQAFPRIGDEASRLAPSGLPGDPPDLRTATPGCAFEPRCPESVPECRTRDIHLWRVDEDRESACIKVAEPSLASPGDAAVTSGRVPR